jgi:hypothetical protein
MGIILMVFPFFPSLLSFAVILGAFTDVTLHSFLVSWMSRSYVGKKENCGCCCWQARVLYLQLSNWLANRKRSG